MPYKKKFVGRVVADKMDKTVVVEVAEVKSHRKYKKQFTVQVRYKAHDEQKEYHVGDIVEIEESRPMSAEKRWRVARKIKWTQNLWFQISDLRI